MPIWVQDKDLFEARKQVLLEAMRRAPNGSSQSIILAVAAEFEQWLLRDPDLELEPESAPKTDAA